MPKHVRRAAFTKTVTFTFTADLAGNPEITDATMLTAIGGASGTSGLTSIGELLARSAASNGSYNAGTWSYVSSTIQNVEAYTVRPNAGALTIGQRVVSVNPVTGNEAALGKVFFVSVAGTTAATSTEPTWNLNDGSGTTTDGSVTYRTLPRFYTPTTFVAATVYSVGTVLRPSANSLKEFLVTTATSASTTTPTWVNIDTVDGSIQSLPGAGAVMCVSGVKTYAFNTAYQIGDVVEPSTGSSDEYICTTGGVSDTTALSATVGNSVTRGTAVFKRIV